MPLNGNGKSETWDLFFKVTQVLILPMLAALLYLLMQINTLQMRLVIIETNLVNAPKLDSNLTGRLLLFEERQRLIMERIQHLDKEFTEHRSKSTYDKQ